MTFNTRAICATAVVGLVSLVAAYYAGPTPHWVYQITWPYPADDLARETALFRLELAALALITLASLGTARQAMPRRAWYWVSGLILVATIAHAVAQVRSGDSAIVRLPYALFSSCMLALWAVSIVAAVRTKGVPIVRVLWSLKAAPGTVVSDSFGLSSLIARLAAQAAVLSGALALWMPTLLPDVSSSPRTIALVLGIVASGILLILPAFAQLRVVEALASSLLRFDRALAEHTENHGEPLAVGEIKDLLEARENLRSAVTLPIRTVLIPVVQSLAAMLALVAAFRAA